MNICDEYSNKTKISRDRLKAATEDELIALLELVNHDTAFISIQLNEAKIKLKASGTYADAEWYQKAKAARKIKGNLSQLIQHELSRKKKDRKEKNREQDEKNQVRLLLQAINLVLTPKQKDKVLDKWRQLRS